MTSDKKRRLLLGLALVLCALTLVALFFSRNILCIQGPVTKADAIVALGGEVLSRPPRALELYRQGAAPIILVTGKGDCQEYRTFLVGKGVPSAVVQIECESRTTSENAKFCTPLLRAQGARRVIIVTSWFHSRRAMRCFRHYAPEIEFISRPTQADLPKAHWPDKRECGRVLTEYIKLAGYWVRHGISPIIL